MGIAHSLEGKDFGVKMRTQLACFGQLSGFSQNGSMTFASDIAGKREEHENNVQGKPSNMYG